MAYESLSRSPAKQDKIKFHLTALDIHPTVIARNLVFLLLLDDLAQGLEEGIREEEQAEIKATYLYTFIGTIMPPYCHARYVRIRWNLMRRIHERGSGCWIKSTTSVCGCSLPPLICRRGSTSTRVPHRPSSPPWITGSRQPPRKTVKGILKHHEYKSPATCTKVSPKCLASTRDSKR